MADLKDVRKILEEKRKEKEALELELAMLEAEPNREILVSIIEGDVALNKKLIGLRADEVREQKKERARVRAAQRKREKAAQETAHRSESVVR